MIEEVVKNAEIFVEKNDKVFCNNNGLWIVFDKTGKPFLGRERVYITKEKDVVYKSLEFFSFFKPRKIRFPFMPDSIVEYEMDLRQQQDLVITAIWVRKKFSGQDVASQLILPSILDASKNEIENIGAYYFPFSHGRRDSEKVKKFYKKQKFDITEKTKPNEYIKKQLFKQDVLDAKLKIINYPSYKNTFTFVFPQNFIFSSEVKFDDTGKEQC